MTTVPIDIIVTIKGDRVVKRKFTDIGNRAKQTRGAVDSLKGALLLLGGARLIRNLFRTADAFTNLQNRLKLVTEGEAQLNRITKELLASSNRTRTSLEINAELFNRLGLATRDLGLSQQVVLDITESLNQAVIVSGASAKEANNGLIQLSQGLASGALRGDELRSVLEQLPAVADVIAKQLNVTRGELRRLGADGKITTDIIIEAFKNAKEELSERFAKTVPTVSQSFQVLKNTFTAVLGELNKGSGVTKLLSDLLLKFGRNAEAVGKGIIAGVFTLAVLGAVVAINLLTAAVAANPVGALIIGLTAVISLIVAFSDDIAVSSDGLTTLRDLGVAVFERLGVVVDAFIGLFSDSFGGIGPLISDIFSNSGLFIEAFIRTTAVGLDGFVGFWIGAIDAIGALLSAFGRSLRLLGQSVNVFFANIAAASKSTFSGEFAEASRQAEQAIDQLKFNLGASFSELNGESLGATIAEGFAKGFQQSTVFEDSVNDLFDRAEQIGKDRAAELGEDSGDELDLSGIGIAVPGTTSGTGNVKLEQVLADLGSEAALLQVNNRERSIQNDLLKIQQDFLTANAEFNEGPGGERAQVLAALDRNQALLEQAELLEDILGPTEELAVKQSALNQLFADGRITAEQFKEQLIEIKIAGLESSTSFADGFSRGIDQIEKDFNDFGSTAEEVLTSAFNKSSDALAKFGTDSQVSFKELASSIIDDLKRIAAQKLIGALFGAIGGGGVPIPAAAEGASARPGQTFLVGEEGPELFQAPSAGNIVPAGETAAMMAAAAQQPAPQVNVEVVNVMDPSEIPSAMSGAEGTEVILNIIQRNPGTVNGFLGKS